jgi:tetratricopeptide (TPR) repeat protein
VPPGASQPTVVQPTFAAGATELASPRARTKPSTPVMTPLPTVASPGAVIQTQVKVQEGLAGTFDRPKSNLFKKPVVLAAAAVVLAGVGFVVVRSVWPSKPPKPPVNAEDQAMETEAKQLWNDRKFDDALEKWHKLADHDGPFHKEALDQVRSISDSHVKVEQLYAAGMKLLYADKKPADAAEKFKEVVDMNLWKADEARKEYDIAMKPNVPAKPLWQALFEEGKQSFDRKEYQSADSILQQVPRAEGVSRDVSKQAKDMLAAIPDREAQKNDFDRAVSLERSGQAQQAFDAFKKVANATHGDRDLVATANDRIRVLDAELRKPKVEPTKNPPALDYRPSIEAARGLISQYRWDDAATKLNGVPQSQPEYNDLMNQINTGRREDQDFLAKKGEFGQDDAKKSQAVASKNKNDAQSIQSELQRLRPFFSTETDSRDRHSSEARNLTIDIDADVKELDAVINAPAVVDNKSTPTGPSAADEIRGVVQSFAKAYDAGDKEAVLAVHQYDVKDEKKLPDVLTNIKGKGYTLRNCTEPRITGNTAVITCEAFLANVPKSPTSQLTMQLRNFNGHWMIMPAK